MKSIYRKSQKGFTLVEVIVVAIIVAALAAVAIPLYTGYVASTRTNAAANAAGSIASFMGACLNQAGVASGVTAKTAATATNAAPLTVSCSVGAASIQLPVDITITINSLDGVTAADRNVVAIHSLGGTSSTYRY